MKKINVLFEWIIAGVIGNAAWAILAILTPIAIAGLATAYSSSPQVVLLWVLIVLVALNTFFTFLVVRKQIPLRRTRDDLNFKVGRLLEKTESRFDEKTDPQRIVVGITNRGNEILYVRKIKLQHHDLPESAVSPSYPKEDSYTVIPFEQKDASVIPGNKFVIELQLRQKWQRADIEPKMGHLGFLFLDVDYGGKRAGEILLQI